MPKQVIEIVNNNDLQINNIERKKDFIEFFHNLKPKSE